MNTEKKVLVLMVTHNSQKFTHWALEPLINNGMCQIRIVDSGSKDTSYLQEYKLKDNIDILFEENLGFAKANNVGLKDIQNFKFVLFLNPDARIEKNELAILIERADSCEYESIGMFSVSLEKYSIVEKKALSYYDSLGIYCDMVGRWKDIQRPCNVKLEENIHYEAICGAFMFCRTKALLSLPDSKGNIGFEESYYMYKEDIELSLRIKRKFGLKIFHDLKAYHCRGWGGKRSKNPYWARKLSAVNDLHLSMCYKNRAFLYALIKYLYVVLWEKK
ncbi:glycosyltransferase [Buttiauxella noackiae]|uniref:glycosyltransferase n=1 Tax=Buttiauxella noackiae TaxID=82992 RepID=UPI00054D19BD|nr:glycosyltransferase [Buttiauxella noackiae]